MMNTGERLKQLRETYQLSQNDVATSLDLSPALISSYERNERMPSPSKLSSLADIYHTTTDYLLCRTITSSVPFLSLDGLSPSQIKLLRELVDTIRK